MSFEQTWKDKESLDFKTWVLRLAQDFENSPYSLQSASRQISTRPAELFAILQVATLSEDLLDEFVRVMPPKTAWLSVCSSSELGAKAALSALDLAKGEKSLSPWRTAEAAIESATGGSVHSKVAQLNSRLISHALKKAKTYDLLNPKERIALSNFASSKKSGKTLTPKQVAYLQILLTRLVEGGALDKDSPDGDVNECLEILEALRDQPL